MTRLLSLRRVAGLVSMSVLTALLALVATGAPAFAHAELSGSNPEQGSTVGSLPDAVELVFTEAVGRPAAVSVIAPDGADLADGAPVIADDTLRQPVAADDMPAGEYTVSYQVQSADGHAISDTVRFTLRGAGQSSAETDTKAASPSDEIDLGLVLALVAGLLAALGLAGLGLVRLIRGAHHD